MRPARRGSSPTRSMPSSPAGRRARPTMDTHSTLRRSTSDPTRRSSIASGCATARHRNDDVECPHGLGCEWIPAPYEDLGEGDYGNHDLADRPHSQKIRYIVIHDTETDYDTTLAAGPGPDLCELAVHAALQRRPRRPAREGQGRRVARRQLVHQRQGDRPRARGIRRPGHLVHRGDVSQLGEAGALPGQAPRHPAGPRAHHRPRQRARHHAGHDPRHALGSGPVLGLGSLLRPAGRAVLRHRRSALRPRHHSPRLRQQPAAVLRLRPGAAGRALSTARLLVGHPAREPDPRLAASSRHRPAPRRLAQHHARLRHRQPASTPASGSRSPIAAATGLPSGTWARRAGSKPARRARPRCGRPAGWRRRSRVSTRFRSTAAPTRKPRPIPKACRRRRSSRSPTSCSPGSATPSASARDRVLPRGHLRPGQARRGARRPPLLPDPVRPPDCVRHGRRRYESSLPPSERRGCRPRPRSRPHPFRGREDGESRKLQR